MFKRMNDGWAMSANKSPLDAGGVHDTFNVDAQGSLNGLHTTVEVPGGYKSIHLDVQPGAFERQTTLFDFKK